MPENFSRIFSVSLNDDSSAQDRFGGAKLVWLEWSGHEDPEYVKKNSSLSATETAMQKFRRCHFVQPKALSEVGETVAYKWPQVVRIATLTKKMDSSQPSLWHYMAWKFLIFLSVYHLLDCPYAN